MPDIDKWVLHSRSNSPNGITTVIDAYEFESHFRNGQVEKVVVIHQPGRGYRTMVHITGKQLMPSNYREGQWGPAKSDLERALREHQCEVFTIHDPRQP
jgi:hypothetical protein